MNLGQLLPSEVQSDGFCVARVVDFDVDLVVILILPDQGGLQTGHLILLPVNQDLRNKHTPHFNQEKCL